MTSVARRDRDPVTPLLATVPRDSTQRTPDKVRGDTCGERGEGPLNVTFFVGADAGAAASLVIMSRPKVFPFLFCILCCVLLSACAMRKEGTRRYTHVLNYGKQAHVLFLTDTYAAHARCLSQICTFVFRNEFCQMSNLGSSPST